MVIETVQYYCPTLCITKVGHKCVCVSVHISLGMDIKENYIILQTKLHYESAYSLLCSSGILTGKFKTDSNQNLKGVIPKQFSGL